LRLSLLTGVVVAGLLLAGCSGSTTGGGSLPLSPGAGSTSSQTFRDPIGMHVERACPEAMSPDVAACLALTRTDIAVSAHYSAITGYEPADLIAAYNLPSSGGTGQTVALVDAYDDPNAEADLGVYRSQFGLPACTTANGCFKKVNQKGQQSNYPTPDQGWATEESLDVDMASAACPNCHIILVEADSNAFNNLSKGVDEAVKLGATVISNSYSAGGNYKALKLGGHYNHPGVIITASAGDGGYGPGLPAGYPWVVAVGGTALHKGGSGRGWSETVWSGTGSGCNTKQQKPSWQSDKGCKGRTMNDVAAVASPGTPVAIYDSYPTGGWGSEGGTSVSSPFIAGVYALAGNAASLNAGQSMYAQGASLYDVTSGSNGTCPSKDAYLCTGEVGYDGPTGNGTPNGVSAF
jgi:subtilase family serine protease